MNMTRMNKTLSCLLCIVLIAAMALVCTGCHDTLPATSGSSDGEQAAATVLGHYFTLSTVDAEGKETVFTVHTDKKTVGEALLAYGIIAGENSTYGLYIKTVNGTTLDYDKDGKYWAFYVGDNYASSGVDTTDIVDGTHYALKAQS